MPSYYFRPPPGLPWVKWHINCYISMSNGMKFPPFLHSHLRLTLLGTPPNRVFFIKFSFPARPIPFIPSGDTATEFYHNTHVEARTDEILTPAAAHGQTRSEKIAFELILWLILLVILGVRLLAESFSVFNLKKITVFPLHGAPDIDGRHPLTLESHNSASMWKLRIPGDEVVQAFMAGDGHNFWFLDAGHWHLIAA